MSTPWNGGPAQDRPSWGGSYGQEGPVDPYAGQAAPLPAPAPYGAPGGWPPASPTPGQGLPGTIIAGSVVGYLFGVLLFLSGLFLLFFGSILGDTFDEIDPSVGDGSTSLVLAGFGNWLAMVLIVAGGIMASLRRSAGLVLTAIGTGLVLLLAVYWVALFPDGAIVFWAFVHVLFAGVVGGLILVPPGNRAWLGPLSGQGPSASYGR